MKYYSQYQPLAIANTSLNGYYLQEKIEYRFAFNGKEKDNETYGDGNEYDYDARIYNPRLGRWFSVDPLYKGHSYVSPFKSLCNNPIVFIDPDGRVEYETVTIKSEKTGKSITIKKVVSQDVMTDGKYQSYYDAEEGKFQPINKYYDFETILSRTITADGRIVETKSKRIMYENKERLSEKYEDLDEKAKPGERKSTGSLLEGNGGVQNGGFFITSNDPLAHASTTKYFSKSEAMKIKLGDVMNMVKLGGINDMNNLFERTKAVDGAVEYYNAGLEATQRVLENLNSANQCKACGYIKYRGREFSPSDTGGQNIKKVNKVSREKYHD